MFGGDHRRLATVVELRKDLTATANRRSSDTPKNKLKYRGGLGSAAGKGRGGSSHGSGGRGRCSGTGPGGKKKSNVVSVLDFDFGSTILSSTGLVVTTTVPPSFSFIRIGLKLCSSTKPILNVR